MARVQRKERSKALTPEEKLAAALVPVEELDQDIMAKIQPDMRYFGEFLEWVGFAVLTWSLSGAVFALWTFANLAPRAARIYDMYQREFPDELDSAKVKRILPYIF